MHKNQLLEKIRADVRENRLNLPTLPEVALAIQRRLESDDASIQDVSDIIAQDAALAARVVHVANSALYRVSRPVTSLPIAVSRLGLERVRSVVMSLVMRQMFQATSDTLDRCFRELWNHSVQVAAVSRFLARHFTRLDPDQAMLAGLMHGIGALPLLMEADHIPGLAEDAATLEALIAELHPEIGRMVLVSWQFAPELAMVPLQHENLARHHEGAPDYTDVVLVANLQLRHGTAHRLGQVDTTRISAFQRLGLPTDLAASRKELNSEEIQQVEEIILGS